MGAWIETTKALHVFCYATSHPVWVRGLKQFSFKTFRESISRTLYGCVD